ncbi:DEAD-box ATP-dependent RNA helicase 32 isoform X1 [Malania oleifera]|uniref:DEAD-box ATP-dependent RNA helicase 32 isoform X1 n=1 Tax=Malania oleifera TaxID=397392 RepID=UPI0025ADD68C|nr:DEAD-box ATP-dependent RNA helicase 32 isoform X1 [Malania oleifera]
MRRPKSKKLQFRKQNRLSEIQEIELLEKWIDYGKPDSGLNPLSLSPLPRDSPVGRLGDDSFSRYASCDRFSQLPLSKKTKSGLSESKYVKMTDIQRLALPHALCGRDILGAAKTGSGKTLSFIIPVLEKLYRLSWGPEDGIGSIIISPTRELASQLFAVLTSVGKHHNFSAGLLIGGRKDVDAEKERVNELNILICTPGRLLQHMDETPNFECSQLQILVLDEADRILDVGFKKALNAIISQLPKSRQTFLFSATQTKSVQDLARLSLKDPEYLSVHEESVTATPDRLQQTAIIVPLNQKLDMLWSFIKSHLNSKILVFLSTRKQVKFVFEVFKKLRPGIPLKCLHGKMNQGERMGVFSWFGESRSVLFTTDVSSRGLDFRMAVDWVVQVDCPENVATYIHRVGRTARYLSVGKSVLFVMPSEMRMLENLQEAKIPIKFNKANTKRLQPVSGLLGALLVKYRDLQHWAQRAFITYLRSIHIQPDKEVFDVMKLPIDEFSASLGLPFSPKVRFLNLKAKSKTEEGKSSVLQLETPNNEHLLDILKEKAMTVDFEILKEKAITDDLEILKEKAITDDFKEEVDKGFLVTKGTSNEEGKNAAAFEDVLPVSGVSKKKKLKINIHRPVGTRVVFDEDGNKLPPLAAIIDSLQRDEVHTFAMMREEMKQADKEDKLQERQRRKEKRLKEKMKGKRRSTEEENGDVEEDMSGSGSDREPTGSRSAKRSKIYFDRDDSDADEKEEEKVEKTSVSADSISVAEQEALALKLLSSMHS